MMSDAFAIFQDPVVSRRHYLSETEWDAVWQKLMSVWGAVFYDCDGLLWRPCVKFTSDCAA